MNTAYNLRKRPTTTPAICQTAAKKRRSVPKKNATVKKVYGIQNLPVEIMTSIFELLDFESRIRVEGVCHRWRDIAIAQSWRKMTSFTASRFFPSNKFVERRRLQLPTKKFSIIAKRCAPYTKEVSLGPMPYRFFSFMYCWHSLLSKIPANQLEHFRCSDSGITNAQLLRLGHRFSNLKSVDIWGYTANTSSLSEFFKTCTLLEQVHLSRCNLAKASFEHLPSSLKGLMMSDCSGMDNSKLAQIGKRCPQLESFQLDDVERDWDLVSPLSKLKHLQKLAIEGYTTVQLPNLEDMKELTHLDISFNDLLTDPLLESIGQLSKLKSLSIFEPLTESYNYTGSGLLHLANLQRLERLSLSGCEHISDSVLKAIIQSNPQLEKLNIPDCTLITDESILFLLDTCQQLNQLDVSGCDYVTNKTLEAIVRRLVEKYGDSSPARDEPEENFFEFDHYGTRIYPEEGKSLENPWLNVIY